MQWGTPMNGTFDLYEQCVNVLLVEDNPGDAELIGDLLAGSGATFELFCVRRLSAALDYLARQSVNLVLLDLFLPDSSGLIGLEKIVRAAPMLPVIVLTGLDDEIVAVKALREGAQDYLIKNEIDQGRLVRALRYAIERKQVENSLRGTAVHLEAEFMSPGANAPLNLPLLEWCEIPQGYVEIEEHKILVSTFQMAKYPVTYTQFEAFIGAPDGYRNDKWWAGLAQRDKTPGEQRWKIDTHPRDHVNWYEAIAFSRWLGAKIGLTVTLPTEAQWQRAAQGDDGREYPWGKKFDKANCNTKESGIGQTTPVDQHLAGASPFGVMDMAGNVWELCLNKWDNLTDTDIGGQAKRVLRGGSWDLNKYHTSASFRAQGYPVLRNSNSGFRVVALLPS